MFDVCNTSISNSETRSQNMGFEQSVAMPVDSRVSSNLVRDRLPEAEEADPIQGAVTIDQSSTPVKKTAKKMDGTFFCMLFFFGTVPALMYLGFIMLHNLYVTVYNLYIKVDHQRNGEGVDSVEDTSGKRPHIIAATEKEVAEYHKADLIKQAEVLKVFRAAQTN